MLIRDIESFVRFVKYILRRAPKTIYHFSYGNETPLFNGVNGTNGGRRPEMNNSIGGA
jgi:hypothetical protein